MVRTARWPHLHPHPGTPLSENRETEGKFRYEWSVGINGGPRWRERQREKIDNSPEGVESPQHHFSQEAENGGYRHWALVLVVETERLWRRKTNAHALAPASTGIGIERQWAVKYPDQYLMCVCVAQ